MNAAGYVRVQLVALLSSRLTVGRNVRIAHPALAGKGGEMKRNVSRGGEARKPTPFYMGDPAQQNRSDTMHRSL